MLIAATLMAIGFAYDAGSGAKELTGVFAGTYVVGCILAVLAVRQAGVFTAVIQPPLLLFGAVPMAYFVFTDSQATNFKDTLINCGYPLIERFPLMFFTSAIVLLIGMARWYLGMSSRRGTPDATAKDEPSGGGLAAGLMSKVSALLAGRGAGDEDDALDEPPRRRSAAARPSRSASRSGKPRSRSTPSRSRHARPPDTELIEPVRERPRRPRPSRQAEPPDEPRRKPRSGSGQRRAMPPPERRAGYERPERRRRFDDDQPPLSHGSNGNGTHHPVSRVRYRDGEEGDDRAPRRTPRDRAIESWEYDI